MARAGRGSVRPTAASGKFGRAIHPNKAQKGDSGVDTEIINSPKHMNLFTNIDINGAARED